MNGPKVSIEDIEANIASEHYFRADEGVFGAAQNPMEPKSLPDNFRVGDVPLSLLTFCVLVLRNGFTVVGHSACVSPENFNAEVGQKIAREKAIEQMWPLMGYALKDRIARGEA